MMNTTLWIAQTFVALVVAAAGITKLVVPRERLQIRMHWAATWPRPRIKLLGLAELAGAVGLTAPAATGIAPLLTPLAAIGVFLLMLGAIATHRRLHESPVAPMVIAVLCLAIAAGRF
jgi:hypothetical protein